MRVLKDLISRVETNRVALYDHAEPDLGLSVLTCMDARIDVLTLLGLKQGDAHIIRNAGGLATPDAIRSLAMSQRLLGTRRILVIQHTDCGIQRVSPAEFEAMVGQETGTQPGWTAPAAQSAEETLDLTLEILRGAEEIPHRDLIEGTVLDLASLAAVNTGGTPAGSPN